MRFNFRALSLAKLARWPHLWPSTDLDCVETVLTRAPESTVFGLKSTKKQTKVVKRLLRDASGTGGLEFESPHFDQKKKRALAVLFFFFVGAGEENFTLRSRRSSFFKRNRRKACFSAASADWSHNWPRQNLLFSYFMNLYIILSIKW